MKLVGCITIVVIALTHSTLGCQFHPPGEYLRFVRVPENLKVGEEVLRVEVFPKRNLSLRPIDKNNDVSFFKYKDVNRTTVSLLLAKSLEDLVDTENPQNVLKFRLMCDYDDGEDVISSSLSVTVYVEDVNDHSPVFQKAPYDVTVDELTPVGLTVFRGIHATDRDKPNTPNSDVQYAITAGNERGNFALDSSHQAFLVLKKPLDYDNGDREFTLTVTASDRGLPPRSTSTNVKISVVDNDDLSPKFTKGVYRTRVMENYPITGEKLHHILNFEPKIFAYDQDVAINSEIRYDIIAGNERRLFYLDHQNGTLYLEREIDLESEKSLPGNSFVLQIQATQTDNPLKTGVARVEVEVMDLNDNLPEFEADIYNISIVENLPNGFSVLQIIAHDHDQGDNAEFSFQLEDKSRAFALDPKTGWLSVRDQTILDREKRSSLSMRVYAIEKTASVVNEKNSASYVNVEVTLLDANDNNPTFLPNNIFDFVTSAENLKVGQMVGQVHAIDPDLGRNGLVHYHIQKAANATYPFKIDPKTGSISIAFLPVSEGRHLIFVEATDQPLNPSERRFSLAVVTIEVKSKRKLDLPDFIGAPYEFWVGGNVDIGTSVGQIRVVNSDDKSPLMYDLLHSYHEGVPFAVEERSGTITVIHDLTKFDRILYDFEAVVTNTKDLTLVTNVTVHVVDPKNKDILLKASGNIPLEFHVKENKPDQYIGKLNITNYKSVKFFVANQRDVTDHITISPNGSLFTVQALDREERDTYRLTIIAEYTRKHGTGTSIYQVVIYVDDENDNPPHFDRDLYEGRIKENIAVGGEVVLNNGIVVKDVDTGSNGQINVYLTGEGSEQFRLDRFGGLKIYYNGHGGLDRENKDIYNLKLIAKDKGGLSGESRLVIYIEDVNDNNPMFTQLVVVPNRGIQVQEYDESGVKVALYQEKESRNKTVYALSQSYVKTRGKARTKVSPVIMIPEDVPVGTAVLKLLAVDKDIGDNAIIKYEMISEIFIPNEKSNTPFHVTQYFSVNPSTGEIIVARTLPAESELRINLTATDKGGLKDYIKVRVLVKDVNDHAPVFKKSWYAFDAEEASYSREILGRIEATDVDYGQNANVSYRIKTSDGERVPFKISEFSGVLSVDGELDRESRDKYSFMVVAQDNPAIGRRFNTSVNVDVNIIDVNDNAPTFYGYDDLLPELIESKTAVYRNHQIERPKRVPVYYATIAENTPMGTVITKVYANDSDFTGNGNGLFLFDIPYKRNLQNTPFAIDSKEGVITTVAKLDYETKKTYNVTIVASDLGSPSLSSTALLVVTVIDVAEDLQNVEHPVFAHRYYEVEVEENVPVPLKILQLNVTEPYRSHKLRYSMVAEKASILRKLFRIDSRNGTLYIIESPDREKGAYYELKIRLDQYKVGRDMTVMVYPVTSERLGDLGLNEVKVIVRITDTNDNVPKFTISGRPIVAAIPTRANFGYHIVRLQATDPDLGLNGEVRYQILGRADEETKRFAIDPITGQVRAISSFARDAGKVFGFDVKATDRRGADDGQSSIANVFVYVLDEDKQLVMVMGSRPTDVEKNIENITYALYNVTGFDVRVRKLEPHFDRNQVDSSATDLYLYAVDPKLNTVVDMDELQMAIQTSQLEIERQLNGPRVLALASGAIERVRFRNHRVVLSTLEVSVVVLGCVVFFGALATAICVICVRRRKQRILQKGFSHGQPLGFPIATLGKPPLFPASYAEGMRYTEGGAEGRRTVYHHRQHDLSCPRYRRALSYAKERSRSVGALETSIASVHSSGKDSGIDGIQCQCGQSTTQSSEDSSNSYEDSLRSIRAQKLQDSLRYGSTTEIQKYYNRRRSISDDVMLGSLRQHHYFHGANLQNHQSNIRKSSERLILACPVNP